MAEDIRRSNSPVFYVDHDEDFTLNLSEQLAMMDSNMFMDDAVVIEDSDNELDNSLDSTISAKSMMITFPMLSLYDTSTHNAASKLRSSIGGFESTPSFVSSLKSAQETKAKSKRRGRPQKVHCQITSLNKKSLQSCSIKATHSKATVNSRKIEGFKCKLSGTWYQITSRDLNVIEAIDRTLQEIRLKIKKLSNPNVRILSLDLHNVEAALGILEDDRLDLEMTKETWQELLLLTKNTFLEVQLEVENLKKMMLKIESQKPFKKKARQGLIEEKEMAKTSDSVSTVRTSTPPKQLITNRSTVNIQSLNQVDTAQQDQSLITEIEIETIEDGNISQGKLDSVCLPAKVPTSTRIQSKSLVTPTNGMGTENDSSDIEIVQVDSTQPLGFQMMSTQLSNWNDFDVDGVAKARCLNFTFPNSEVLHQDRQVIISQDNSQNLQEEIVIPKPPNSSKTLSKSFSTVRGKKFKKPPRKYIHSEEHRSELQLNRAVKERVSKFLAVARRSFDFSSLIKARCLIPGKTLTICINNQNYNAEVKQDSTLETDDGIKFSGLAQWIKSIMGKPYSRLTVKEQRSVQILYEDVPLEDILDGVDLEHGCQSFETLDLSSEQLNSLDKSRETHDSLNWPHDTLKSGGVNLLLVPDETNRNVKSLIIHSEAEYFPTCKCYEKSWAGEDPFPRHYLDDLENW